MNANAVTDTPREWRESGSPGTAEARDKGCACPVIDNHYGSGRYGDGRQHGWLVNSACPLHGAANDIPRASAKARITEALDGRAALTAPAQGRSRTMASKRVDFNGVIQGSVTVRAGESEGEAIERAEQHLLRILDRHARRYGYERGTGPVIGLEEVDSDA